MLNGVENLKGDILFEWKEIVGDWDQTLAGEQPDLGDVDLPTLYKDWK